MKLVLEDCTGMKFRLLICFFLGLLSLSYALGMAPNQVKFQAINWADSEPRLSLTPRLRYFKENPGQSLDWGHAINAGNWQDADPKGMSALYKPTTMWMLTEVVNSSNTTQTRWVVINDRALSDAQLFVLDSQQPTMLAHQWAGQRLALKQRAINTDKPAFDVTLLPGQRVRLLIRVSDLYWHHMNLDAWDRVAFIQADGNEKLTFAVVLGAAMALAVMLLLRRSKESTLAAVWLMFSLMMELAFTGLAPDVPWRMLSPVMSLPLLGVLINCAFSFLILYFMELAAKRSLVHWNWGLFGATVLLTMLGLGSPSHAMRQALFLFFLLQLLSNLMLLFWTNIRGNSLRLWMMVIMFINFGLDLGRVLMHQLYLSTENFEILMSVIFMTKCILVPTVIALVILKEISDKKNRRDQRRMTSQAERQAWDAALENSTSELQNALEKVTAADNSKTSFLARISHDLRSPLTTISGNAQLLQRAGGRTARLAHSIMRSADHMLVLVTDLVSQAHGEGSEHVEPTAVYIHGLLDDVAREAYTLCKRGKNSFQIILESDLPAVLKVDVKRIRQILTNLLDNAAKFTQNGSIELVVSIQSSPVATSQSNSLNLKMAVRDTGQGIGSDEIKKIFQEYYRANGSEKVKGIGLGLAIVLTWAERMGGSVEVNSTLGKGSIFTLHLPVEKGTEEEMQPTNWIEPSLYLPGLNGEGQEIWLVEDNIDIREMLHEELSSTGFKVVAMNDGHELLMRIRSPDEKQPSLVITDFLMPRADGLAVLRGLRKRWPILPVVVLTATNMGMHSLQIGIKNGFDAVLSKPLNFADLRTTLARLLQLDLDNDDLITQPGDLQPLDMVRAGVPVSSEAEMPFVQMPPANELAQVRQWVELGAFTDLTEWAEDVQRRLPNCVDFGKLVQVLLESGRLLEICDLCDKGNAS